MTRDAVARIEYGRTMGRFYWHCWDCETGWACERLSEALSAGREHLADIHG